MTTIAWTGESWNPIKATHNETGKRGWFCEKVSPGCTNCYAEGMNGYRGNGLKYRVGNRDKVTLAIDDKAALEPVRIVKAKRIFPCSMTDLFLDAHTDLMLDRVHVVMAFCRRHTFQVLTKRPERARDYYHELFSDSEFVNDRWDLARQWLIDELRKPGPGSIGVTPRRRIRFEREKEYIGIMMADSLSRPFPNLWLGVSAEDQERFDQRWPVLRDIPAAVRWVSQEPALGPVNFFEAFCEPTDLLYRGLSIWYGPDGFDPSGSQPVKTFRVRTEPLLHWVVVGGESGGSARDFDIDWARYTVAQCRAGGARPFVKQLGRKPFERNLTDDPTSIRLVDAKGEDPSEWPEDLRVREYPEARV